MTIRVGIGGWTYEPWRGTFYPPGLAQKRELDHASRRLTSIEINATFYGAQKPASFARWRDETPDGFVFAVKGPRFATQRPKLAEAAPSIERFFTTGVLELGDKLGPINWQLPPFKRFEPDDFAAFLALLPPSVEGRVIRHAVEVRHASFRDPALIPLLREKDVAVVLTDAEKYPNINDVTAPFVYARLQRSAEHEADGYPPAALDQWAARAESWAGGAVPDDLPLLAEPETAAPHGRDVFIFVIDGFKPKAPAAAEGLIRRLREK